MRKLILIVCLVLFGSAPLAHTPSVDYELQYAAFVAIWSGTPHEDKDIFCRHFLADPLNTYRVMDGQAEYGVIKEAFDDFFEDACAAGI